MNQAISTQHKRLAVQARAGIIFESDNRADEEFLRMDRTSRIIHRFKTNLGAPTRVSDDRAITDILADLRHYCDCKGLEFVKLSILADALYWETRAGDPE